MSALLAGELLRVIQIAVDDPAIRCIVLAGTSRYFCVGADLKESFGFKAVDSVLAGWMSGLDSLRKCPKPIIAAVRGAAIGGGLELALYCDLIVASEDAKFALPETGIGVIAGQGGSQRVAALAGRSVATDMILTGRVLSGTEAYALGIVARVAETEKVLEVSMQMASDIADRGPAAVQFAREVIFEATEGALRQSLRIERLLAALVLETKDAQTRIGGFLERKR
jgi:enoyl-CoA hydratase/carnithine racemase